MTKTMTKRETLLAETSGRCIWCGAPLTARTMTFDHIIPQAAGGSDSMANLAASCALCNNSRKGSMLPSAFLGSLPEAGAKAVRRRAAEAVAASLMPGTKGALISGQNMSRETLLKRGVLCPEPEPAAGGAGVRALVDAALAQGGDVRLRVSLPDGGLLRVSVTRGCRPTLLRRISAILHPFRADSGTSM